jgi:hypothetical protein
LRPPWWSSIAIRFFSGRLKEMERCDRSLANLPAEIEKRIYQRLVRLATKFKRHYGRRTMARHVRKFEMEKEKDLLDISVGCKM